MIRLYFILFYLSLPLLIIAQGDDKSNIPKSKYFVNERIFATGNNKQLFVWVEPRAPRLIETLETFPKSNILQFEFLILNKSINRLNVRPISLIIIFKDGHTDDVFPGERWTDVMTGKTDKSIHSGPSILEVNCEDVSLYDLDSVTLRKGDSAVLLGSFVADKLDTYDSFINKIKGFKIKIEPFKGKSFELLINIPSNK